MSFFISYPLCLSSLVHISSLESIGSRADIMISGWSRVWYERMPCNNLYGSIYRKLLIWMFKKGLQWKKDWIHSYNRAWMSQKWNSAKGFRNILQNDCVTNQCVSNVCESCFCLCLFFICKLIKGCWWHIGLIQLFILCIDVILNVFM